MAFAVSADVDRHDSARLLYDCSWHARSPGTKRVVRNRRWNDKRDWIS